MLSQIQAIATKHSLSSKVEESTYDLSFEIRNLVQKKITLFKKSDSFSIHATYEYLAGTSTKPSFSSGNTADKYIASIQCIIATTKIPDFRIIESGGIKRWIRKIPLTIISKDKYTKEKFNQSKLIHQLFQTCIETAEFSPSIQGINKNGSLEVSINFQSYLFYPEQFETCIELCFLFKNNS